MDRAVMGTSLVLRIARFEVASMVAGEQEDRVFLQTLLAQGRSEPADRVIHALHTPIIIAELTRPRAAERTQILRHERISILVGVLFRWLIGIEIVLMMSFEIGDGE